MYNYIKKIKTNLTETPIDVFICGNTITATKTTSPSMQVRTSGDFCLTETLDKIEAFMLTVAVAIEAICSGKIEKKAPCITIITKTNISIETQQEISQCLFRIGISMLKFSNAENGNDIEWKSPGLLKLNA